MEGVQVEGLGRRWLVDLLCSISYCLFASHSFFLSFRSAMMLLLYFYHRSCESCSSS